MNFRVLLVAAALIVGGLSARADGLPENVVIQKSLTIYFAPAEHRGVFLLQVLKSGVIQRVDNKKVTTVLGQLTEQTVAKLQSNIDRLADNELQEPSRPACADAPSLSVSVRKTSGDEEKIWRKSNCRVWDSNSALAQRIADFMNQLDGSLKTLDYLDNIEK